MAVALGGLARSGWLRSRVAVVRDASLLVFSRVARSFLTVVAFALISVGVFLASPVAGFIVAGLLLLVLDYAVEDE